jgi:hypothetical protein
MPLEGPSAAAQLDVGLSVDRGPGTPMEPCGQTCRRAVVALEGGERLAIEVAGPAGEPRRSPFPPCLRPTGQNLWKGWTGGCISSRRTA